MKCSATCDIARVASIARWVGVRARASSIAFASASEFPGSVNQPVWPLIIVSWAPPWLLAMMGRPMAWASTGTRPKPSGSVEGQTTTVASI